MRGLKFWEEYWKVRGPHSSRRAKTVTQVVWDDSSLAALKFNKFNWIGGMENVYRVRIDQRKGEVEVACLGVGAVDAGQEEGIFDSVNELPMWIQERLAVLSLMKVDPPQTKVEGIGMRVSEDIFWVIKGDSND